MDLSNRNQPQTVRDRLAGIAPSLLTNLEKFATGQMECPKCGGSGEYTYRSGKTIACRRCGGRKTVEVPPAISCDISRYLLDQAIGKAAQSVQVSNKPGEAFAWNIHCDKDTAAMLAKLGDG